MNTMQLIRQLNDFSNKNPVLKPIKYLGAHNYHNFWLNCVLKLPNRTDYKVLGLRRTGNHAIIGWIFRHTSGLTCFCNDLMLEQVPKEAPIKKTRLGKLTHPHLIYSYEDWDPNKVFSSKHNSFINERIGQAKTSKYILIIRDPYNLFASRWTKPSKIGYLFRQDIEHRKKIVQLWKIQAEFYLNQERKNDPLFTFINYNDWVEKPSYKKALLNTLKLEIKSEKKNDNKVWSMGNGSSFDGLSYQDTPEKMDVLNRWKRYADEPWFKDIFKDQELIELSSQIFGKRS